MAAPSLTSGLLDIPLPPFYLPIRQHCISPHAGLPAEYESRMTPEERQRWLDAVEGKPHVPQGSPDDHDPNAGRGLVITGACLMLLFMLYKCWEFVTSAGPNDGWFGLAFTALILLLMTGYWVWEIRECSKKDVRTSRDFSSPIVEEEEREEGRTYEEEEQILEQERERILEQEMTSEEEMRRLEQDMMYEDEERRLEQEREEDDMRADNFDNFPIDRKEDWD